MKSVFGKKLARLRSVAITVALIVTTASAYAQGAGAKGQIDEVLRKAVEEKHLPGVVAMVSSGDRVVYQGAFGKSSSSKNTPMTADAIFRIASMTKTVTTVAVMQLVEKGQIKLDEPASTYAPELARVEVLEGFDANGKPKLRAPKSAITIRQLLTHTSGYAYEFFDEKMGRYVASGAMPSAMAGDDGFLKAPLMFDPGTRWEYGISIDWLGRIVEKLSGKSLEEYFRQNIFAPMGMNDTFFNVPAEKQARVVALYQRKDDGTLAENPPQEFKPARFFSGGGGLFSTAIDYLKFTRMLLARGKLGKTTILKPATVDMMARNQIGDLNLVEMKSQAPQLARSIAMPGGLNKFGFGFAINTNAVEGGRGAGSMAWAGIFNTFYWIDPANKKTAVLMMQLLPFLDDAPKSVLEEFERAVYAKAPAPR